MKASVFDSLRHVVRQKQFDIKAINFSAYGASFVYLDENGEPLCPLYNYLKPYPEILSSTFYHNYGGEGSFSLKTASPVLGSLNSGMQIYRIKKEKPRLFEKIKYALHLPQYLSFLITGQYYTDITSIGCHTNLWDFPKKSYHDWVTLEGLDEKLPPLLPSDTVIGTEYRGRACQTGIGLHDSSAALIPYLASFSEPFILLSTGTWCISLNPFNNTSLTQRELKNDCLSYISYKGDPVKASRVFAGNEHEQQASRIASHFNQRSSFYKDLKFDHEIIRKLTSRPEYTDASVLQENKLAHSGFEKRNLNNYRTYKEAYHQLMIDLVAQQVYSTNLILGDGSVKRIFVDGGFGKNPIYMNLLASSFPGMEVFAASMAQATALGAALAIHRSWNLNPIPSDIIELKYYSLTQPV
ncbi:MAG: FGGY family carbohydrate kinase [Daejeonella sp.]